MTTKQQALIVQRMVQEKLDKEKEEIRSLTATAMMAATLMVEEADGATPDQLIDKMERIFNQFHCILRDKDVTIQGFLSYLEDKGVEVIYKNPESEDKAK
jgi:Na+/phosphate symporter